jgi:flagellin
MIRLRELAVQSANGTLGTSERNALDKEFGDLVTEVSRIANVTKFNGTAMLNDSSISITFQVGVNNTTDDQIAVTGVNATASGLGLSGVSVATLTQAQSALAILDSAISQVATLRASFGTAQNRLESTIRSLAVSIENATAAESRIRDVDVASETAELTRNQVLQQAGISVLAQANTSSQSVLRLLQ